MGKNLVPLVPGLYVGATVAGQSAVGAGLVAALVRDAVVHVVVVHARSASDTLIDDASRGASVAIGDQCVQHCHGERQ